ncbi:hypothetical protein K470DRAFT_256536, partial [Piedraia hortae CBS 480.64]
FRRDLYAGTHLLTIIIVGFCESAASGVDGLHQSLLRAFNRTETFRENLLEPRLYHSHEVVGGSKLSQICAKPNTRWVLNQGNAQIED